MGRLLPFRPMTHWGKHVPVETQQRVFVLAGDEFFYGEVCAIIKTLGIEGPSRAADRLQQRWRKAGLIVFGDGKWYRTSHGTNVAQAIVDCPALVDVGS